MNLPRTYQGHGEARRRIPSMNVDVVVEFERRKGHFSPRKQANLMLPLSCWYVS